MWNVWKGARPVLAALATLTAACGGSDDGGTGPDTPVATTLAIVPSEHMLPTAGATVQLGAIVRDQNGQVMAGALVSWSSEATGVATVNAATGLVTAVGAGNADIRAVSGSAQGTARVTVLGDAAVVLTADPTKVQTGFPAWRVTTALGNHGGPGVYVLEFWRLPSVPNGPALLEAKTEAIAVPAGYAETVQWDVPASRVDWIIVRTRSDGSAAYRQTDRFDFPP